MTDTPPAPAVTVHNDENPCPRVEVLVSPMTDDAAAITVWRNFNGGRSSVRGAVATVVAGDFLVIDYEAPLQTPVTYTCQTYDSGGTASDLSDPSGTVDIDEPRAWLQDPLGPSSAMPIGLTRFLIATGGYGLGLFGVGTFGGGAFLTQRDAVFRAASFAVASRAADITVSPVFGSGLPVAGSSARRDVSDMPVEIRTVGAQTDTMRALLNQASFPLLRTGPRVPMLTPLTYLALPDLAEHWMPGVEMTIWTATGQSVQQPGAAVILAVRTYDDLLDEATAYSHLLDLYATYVDMLRGS